MQIWYNIHNIGRCAVTPLAARTFDQIYAALGAGYDGSANLLNQKMNALPGMADAEISGLDAKLKQANTGIVDGARRRGIGFSGIPIAEQAQYAATDYAPAVARVREGARNQAMSLQEALLGLERDRRTQAESIYNNEMARDLAERQFAEQMAASRAAASGGGGGGYSYGGGGGTQQQTQQQAPPAQDEQDAQYLGRLRTLPQSQQVQIIAAIRKGAKSDPNSRNGRLYNLGRQLGYWKF